MLFCKIYMIQSDMTLTLQFLSLKVGDERQQLVPVLTTMFKLSPEKKTTLDATTQSNIDNFKFIYSRIYFFELS